MFFTHIFLGTRTTKNAGLATKMLTSSSKSLASSERSKNMKIIINSVAEKRD